MGKIKNMNAVKLESGARVRLRNFGATLFGASAGPPLSAVPTIPLMAEGSPSGFSLAQKVPILTQPLQADQGGRKAPVCQDCLLTCQAAFMPYI